MASVQETIEIDVPVQTAYNQWTQFEEFPQFMEGVEQVTQVDDTHLEWKAKIGGVSRTWDAEIVEQVPDRRISWRSTSGSMNAGTVTFEPLAADRSRVLLQLEFEPEGAVEKAGDALGIVERRAKGDLERFGELITTRGRETGAWRGQV
jgi:uncharacterized membrane protein